MRVSDALRMSSNDDEDDNPIGKLKPIGDYLNDDDHPASDLIPDPGFDPVADLYPGEIDPDDIITPADDEDDRDDDDDCDPDDPDTDDDDECRYDSDPTGLYYRQFVAGGV